MMDHSKCCLKPGLIYSLPIHESAPPVLHALPSLLMPGRRLELGLAGHPTQGLESDVGHDPKPQRLLFSELCKSSPAG